MYTITTVHLDFFPRPPSVSSRHPGSHPSTPHVLCVCVRTHTHTISLVVRRFNCLVEIQHKLSCALTQYDILCGHKIHTLRHNNTINSPKLMCARCNMCCIARFPLFITSNNQYYVCALGELEAPDAAEESLIATVTHESLLYRAAEMHVHNHIS